jgi:hypothetical protein
VGDGDPEPREIVVSAAVRVGRGHLDEHAVGRAANTSRTACSDAFLGQCGQMMSPKLMQKLMPPCGCSSQLAAPMRGGGR